MTVFYVHGRERVQSIYYDPLIQLPFCGYVAKQQQNAAIAAHRFLWSSSAGNEFRFADRPIEWILGAIATKSSNVFM